MTQRNPSSLSGLPSAEQVTELLADEFARAGYEIDGVEVDERCKPPRIRVIADGDTPLDLDAVSALSRAAADVLDTLDTPPYVLEVSSPGVDRPLTEEKHFRRASGRRVEVSLNDGTAVTGRLGATAQGVAALVVRSGSGWEVRRLPLNEIRKAVVQVEFSPPSAKEIELVGTTGSIPAESMEAGA